MSDEEYEEYLSGIEPDRLEKLYYVKIDNSKYEYLDDENNQIEKDSFPEKIERVDVLLDLYFIKVAPFISETKVYGNTWSVNVVEQAMSGFGVYQTDHVFQEDDLSGIIPMLVVDPQQLDVAQYRPYHDGLVALFEDQDIDLNNVLSSPALYQVVADLRNGVAEMNWLSSASIDFAPFKNLEDIVGWGSYIVLSAIAGNELNTIPLRCIYPLDKIRSFGGLSSVGNPGGMTFVAGDQYNTDILEFFNRE